jgi:uncharacterized membrane protein
VKTPLVGSIAAPAGAPVKLNVSAWAGSSISVAEAVKVSSTSSLTVLFPIGLRIGSSLTAVTVILTVATLLTSSPSSALKVKLSVP